MIQLILGGIVMPEAENDNYSCYPSELATQLDMISGRRVKEVRGNVQIIEYSYEYFTNEFWAPLAAVVRSGNPINVAYLPDDSTEMHTSVFVVEKIKNPTFSFSDKGVPQWAGFSIILREQRPHD